MQSRFVKDIRVLAPIIFNEKVRIISGMILTGVSIGLNLLTPYLISKTIVSLSENKPAEIAGLEIQPLVMAGIFAANYSVIRDSVAISRNMILAPIAPRASQTLMIKYVDQIMHQSLSYHIDTPFGDHVNRATKCFISIPNLTTNMITQVVPTALEIGIAMGVLSKWYGYEIGLGLGAVIVSYAGFTISTKNLIIASRDEMTNKGYKSFEEFAAVIANYKIIHAFNNLILAMKKYTLSQQESTDADIKGIQIINKINLGQSLIAGVGFFSLCVLMAHNVLKMKNSIDDFISLFVYLQQFSEPLKIFGNATNQLLASITELDIVVQELDKPSAIPDAYPNIELDVTSKTASIEFKNVSFSYRPDVTVLDDISFSVEPGKKLGIVGVSGSGKSTIGSLLFRFYDPLRGNIYINGQDTSMVGLSSLRSNIGIVPQTSTLFNDTLYNNIAYGGLSQIDDMKQAKVQDVVKRACLEFTVNKLPEGLETKVGEGGAKLSGGQCQRVAIARALYINPKILIFDESTSALDSKVEREISRNIDEVSRGITSIHITHRLSSLVNADKIIVLNLGKIAEQGTHEELLAIDNGIYAGLWHEQLSDAKEQPLPMMIQNKSILFQPVSPRKESVEITIEDAKESQTAFKPKVIS